jgi:hypothetical protein
MNILEDYSEDEAKQKVESIGREVNLPVKSPPVITGA